MPIVFRCSKCGAVIAIMNIRGAVIFHAENMYTKVSGYHKDVIYEYLREHLGVCPFCGKPISSSPEHVDVHAI